jgi:hypothetical protein
MVQTTERYLGCKQRFRQAVNDQIGIDSESRTGPITSGPYDNADYGVREHCLPVDGFPTLRSLAESLLVDWPIVQDRWVKIRAVWPNQRVDLKIDLDPVEKREFAQRSVQLSRQYLQKVYRAIRAVREFNCQSIGPDDRKSRHAMYGVFHVFYFNGSIG